MKETIYCTINGERREVTLTQPTGFTYMELAMAAPFSLSEGELDEEGVKWLKKVVEEVCDLPRAEVEQVPPREMNRLICASAQVFAGEEVNLPSGNDEEDDYRYEPPSNFEGLFDTDENGYVDTDDWR